MTTTSIALRLATHIDDPLKTGLGRIRIIWVSLRDIHPYDSDLQRDRNWPFNISFTPLTLSLAKAQPTALICVLLAGSSVNLSMYPIVA
ncbi:MAG: hypothetical protein WBO98_04910 [Candidatus Nitrotoga sp.]